MGTVIVNVKTLVSMSKGKERARRVDSLTTGDAHVASITGSE